VNIDFGWALVATKFSYSASKTVTSHSSAESAFLWDEIWGFDSFAVFPKPEEQDQMNAEMINMAKRFFIANGLLKVMIYFITNELSVNFFFGVIKRNNIGFA